MIVFVNGSFGIGKSTVAAHLRRRIAGSAVFDPERVGFVLHRLLELGIPVRAPS